MIKTRLVLVSLLVAVGAASAEPGGGPSYLVATPATPNPKPRRDGAIGAAKRGSRFSRLRVPLEFALLSLSSRSRLRKEPFEKVPLLPGQIEVTRLLETPHLTVERIRFWSEQMGETRFFLALVPKTPAQPAAVLILNHGWFDRPDYLLKYLHVDQVYDTLLGRDELRPAILVIPDVRFKSLHHLRSDPFPDYLGLVAEEVFGIVSRRYGIPFERSRWAIGGFSFGGYLSLDIARRYPGRFASVSVVSGLFEPKWTFWPSPSPASGTLELDGGRTRQTVVVPGSVPRLFLACGTNDWLFGTMQSLHQTMEGIGIPGEWDTGPGGHTWKYWSSVLQSMLMFHLRSDPKTEVTQ